ncbi:glycosyltransferase [Gorillibacterium sp. sgz500922]|uniref:glycosyltransferase n=1 Tax=Gorillibacterium sp. sgz500922 TaxID=3446694 RepID=UPI003F6725E2
MKPYRVFWRGPIGRRTGLGNASREYLKALRGQGAAVETETSGRPGAARPAGELRVLVHHFPPHAINFGLDRKRYDRLILNTVWETTRFPRSWVPRMNRFDAVFVPSRQNKQALRDSGVTVPIHLVPHGVNAARFRPGSSPSSLLNGEKRFVFLSVFTFQHRKNPEGLLRAYWQEFKADEPVLLVIKTSGFSGDTEATIQQKVEAYKASLGLGGVKTAPVTVIARQVKEQELKGLYGRADAFVLPTRGEGVGLPFLEALASGTPVIATRWGGQMDFLHAGNAFLVDYKLAPPGVSMKSKHALARRFRGLFDQPGQLWAEPDIASLRKQMRAAFSNPTLCRAKGKQGRQDMLRLSWPHAGNTLKRAIEQVVAGPKRS